MSPKFKAYRTFTPAPSVFAGTPYFGAAGVHGGTAAVYQFADRRIEAPSGKEADPGRQPGHNRALFYRHGNGLRRQ